LGIKDLVVVVVVASSSINEMMHNSLAYLRKNIYKCLLGSTVLFRKLCKEVAPNLVQISFPKIKYIIGWW
jgi:hypothetical protein